MKIRQGFVSNSSSASFVVRFQSQIPREKIEELIVKSDSRIESEWNKTTIEVVDMEASKMGHGIFDLVYKEVEATPKKESLQHNEGVYAFHDDTIMFNDWMDIPTWKFFRLLSERRFRGLKLIEIIKVEDENTTINENVDFDPLCFEEHDKEYWKNTVRQREIEIEYIQYLINIGIKPSIKEIKLILSK